MAWKHVAISFNCKNPPKIQLFLFFLPSPTLLFIPLWRLLVHCLYFWGASIQTAALVVLWGNLKSTLKVSWNNQHSSKLTVLFFPFPLPPSSLKGFVPPWGFYTQTSLRQLPYTLPFMGIISLSSTPFAGDAKHCQVRMAPGGRNDDKIDQAESHLFFLMTPTFHFGFFKSSETAFHSQSNCSAASLVLFCFSVPFVFFSLYSNLYAW